MTRKHSTVLVVGGLLLATAVPALCAVVAVPESSFPLEFGVTAVSVGGFLIWSSRRKAGRSKNSSQS